MVCEEKVRMAAAVTSYLPFALHSLPTAHLVFFYLRAAASPYYNLAATAKSHERDQRCKKVETKVL
jgi:hypothetical protein